MISGFNAAKAVPTAAHRQRILVVEDELLIRFMVCEHLRDAGYDTVEACSADEAIAMLASPVLIDLVITDVRMPGSRDGLGLLAFIRGALPRLPVIVMSGHLEPGFALVGGATQFIAKPFKLSAVVDAVRAALGKDG